MNGKTRSSSQERADQTGDLARRVAGIVRRMAVGVTSGTFWQVLGHELLDRTTETRDAEVFGGVGIVARPPSGTRAEAIVVFPGGASQPMIVGARDLDTARSAVGELAEDETAIYTGKLVIKLRSDETVTICKVGGTPVELATKADLDKLMTAISTAIAAMGGAGPAPELAALRTALQALLPLWPVGTSVLKAE